MDQRPQSQEYLPTLDEKGRPSRVYAVPGGLSERIENDFTYHAPKPDQLPRYEAIRDKARELAHLILQTTPVSRDQSLSITALEECVFRANAAIARNE